MGLEDALLDAQAQADKAAGDAINRRSAALLGRHREYLNREYGPAGDAQPGDGLVGETEGGGTDDDGGRRTPRVTSGSGTDAVSQPGERTVGG